MGPKNLPPHEAANLGEDVTAPASGVYDTLADKVGLIPNVRAKDNALQALVCAGCALAGAVGATLVSPGAFTPLMVGVLLGLVVGLLGSGGVLMIVGLVRR